MCVNNLLLLVFFVFVSCNSHKVKVTIENKASSDTGKIISFTCGPSAGLGSSKIRSVFDNIKAGETLIKVIDVDCPDYLASYATDPQGDRYILGTCKISENKKVSMAIDRLSKNGIKCIP